MRIGMGYDVHKLITERKLIIGGVEIPYEKGLLGHSDADVLTHAVMDSMLGAAGLGDIGVHFPDTDPAYSGISSFKLLAKVAELLAENLFFIENIDATIIAQAPMMRPHIDTMRTNFANTLGILTTQINIKATTEEGLGFTGSGEGIAAKAICLLTSPVNMVAEEVSASAENANAERSCASCGGCPKNN
ncbi:MAG: 2-C-methyl-D-erythritol 2,4-cyclodiphosphate synthase [Lachnospiraceae bacterium]|nr:2-C-methyl-D-erythritol 2,4-cyclodiphosphate synthase [Lachnospiraceae bacterium]